MYSIQFSPLAKEDLMKLKRYLIEEFDTAIASDKMKSLIESIRKFEEYPLLGRPLTNLIDIPTDYMYVVSDKNYIFYRLEGNVVHIIRVLDARQDFMNFLFSRR